MEKPMAKIHGHRCVTESGGYSQVASELIGTMMIIYDIGNTLFSDKPISYILPKKHTKAT
jgi:hypothetical protein